MQECYDAKEHRFYENLATVFLIGLVGFPSPPQQNHRERPVHVSGANVRTRSNVEFGRPILGGLFYSTAAQEDYPKRDINRARPHTHPSGHVLTGQGERETKTFSDVPVSWVPFHIN
jgi:hypothetical protein